MSDAAAGVTYKYSISSGVATNQTLFASVAATAMDVDTQGNVYLATSSGVLVYSSAGTLLMTVPVDPPAPRSRACRPVGTQLRRQRKADAVHHHRHRPVLAGAGHARRDDQRRADDRRHHPRRSSIRLPPTPIGSPAT